MPNTTNITPPRVAMVDPKTGIITRDWYRFFSSLFNLTGAGTNQIALDELQIGPDGGVDSGLAVIESQIQDLNLAPPPIIYTPSSSGTATAWGTITGTLSAQTDLQTALNTKISGIAVSNDTTTAVTVRPLWTTGTSGGATAFYVSSGLGFVPSTGVFSAPYFSGDGSSLTNTVNVLDNVVSASTVYPLWYTGTGTSNTAYISTTKMFFTPSTGALTSTTFNTPAASSAQLVTPSSGVTRSGSQLWANRSMPFFREPTGNGYAVQGHFAQRNIRQWRFGAGTTVSTLAAATGVFPYSCVSPATPTIPAVVAAAPYLRSTIGTLGTAGSICSIRSGTTNIGCVIVGTPFLATFRFGIAAMGATARIFVGLTDSTTAATNVDPLSTTTPGGLGMATNGSGQDFVIVNNVTGTARTNTTLSSGSISGKYSPIASVNKWELAIWSDGTNIYWQTSVFTDNTSTPYYINNGTFSDNKPATNTLLYPTLWIANNTTASSVVLDLLSVTLETEY